MNVHHICLKCEKTLVRGTRRMECLVCGTQWPVDRGIPSYDSAKYYGEVSQETMLGLIALAEIDHWRSAARTVFEQSNPELYNYVADLNRASWIPILPIGPHSTVLDVNSGLGAVTHALALNYHHVVSVEPVAEMARFAKLRLDQEGLKNVELVHTTLGVLPFSKGTFDLIVLNGVLEWVRQWRSSRTSRQAQIEALKNLRRLLKPHGVLVLGSENRIAHTRFLHRTDHAPRQFTNPMVRWLPSLHRRLKRPGFYRSLMDPTKGHRPYTHTPHGYLKLLRQAGFPLVDLWWPPNGYNSPHTLFRASSCLAIKAHWDHERRYKDRLHGYALARQVRHWALVDTGLISVMCPDVIMIATPISKRDKQHRAVPLLAAFEACLPKEPESSAKAVGSRDNQYYADSLTTHHYRNKTVINVVSCANDTAVVKVANVRLPGAETLHRTYHKLQRLSSSFDGSDLLAAGSIPSPLAIVRVGSLLATMERSARGTRLVDLILHHQYFDSRDRVRIHLERITSWLITSKPALDALGSDNLFEPIPLDWFLPPAGDSAAAAGSIPERLSAAQHGDFTPENIFIDETSGHVSVIDWDDCGTGYPPLFDWFSLVTGLYYYTDTPPRFPTGQTREFLSFRHTYFAESWFPDLILSLSHHLCQSLHLDSARLLDYFRAYLVVRYRQCCRGGGSFLPHLYKQYYEFLQQNQKHCCFWHSLGR